MTRKIAIAVAATASFGMVLAVSAAGDFYPGGEFTNNWFNANLPTAADVASISTGAPWTAPGGGSASIESHVLKFDADATSPLVYTPTAGASGKLALVNVSLVVEPNIVMPTIDGLDNAQAALSVVTNTTSGNLDWVGIVRDGGTRKWVVLDGSHPAAGSSYDVQIAIDNTGDKLIRYAVKPSSATDYSILHTNSVEWFENPKLDMTSVSAVAFAGAGQVDDLSGVSIQNDGADVSLTGGSHGVDFTNGTVTAVVTIPADNASASARTAILTVVKFDGTKQVYDAQGVTSGQTISWDLSNLTPGGVYSYSLSVKSGNEVREVKSGTFTAAIWDPDYWFKAVVSGGEACVTNGQWNGAVELNVDDARWDVSSEALFSVADKAPGSNVVTRVDTTYSFETFVDLESLEPLDSTAVGGIVAVEGGIWYAYAADGGNADPSWQALAGAVVPETNSVYVIRAEFDFMSSVHRVRYSVSDDAGANFCPLTLGGNEWIRLAAENVGTLSSVGMSGKGYVKSIYARVADKSVVKDGAGRRYDTIWDAVGALDSDGESLTLLTGATFKPSNPSAKRRFTINKNGFQLIIDKSGLNGWRLISSGDSYYLMKPGATYIFF